MIPGWTLLPDIVNVFPELLWPYANIVPNKKQKQHNLIEHLNLHNTHVMIKLSSGGWNKYKQQTCQQV